MAGKKKTSRGARRAATGTRVRMEVDGRRRQLIELGLRAFTARPYDEVSTDAIAAEAGISRGLLFHYFSTKHGYYVACLEVAAEELVREAFSREEGSPLERLLAGLDAYFRYVGAHASGYATLLRAGVGSDPVVKRLVDATRERIIERIRADLAPFLPPETDPRLVRAGLRGWIGLVEALALDWVDRPELSPGELVALCMRALVAALPAGIEAFPFGGGFADPPRA
ncbi:MAG TPA: TetR/AcrR family transcriptional regulator [Planctomycetota bacterium]|nr:TetR/AcrR family transcriptional regulator [Planctomycetota bacterium]